jgi:hypothetical protein
MRSREIELQNKTLVQSFQRLINRENPFKENTLKSTRARNIPTCLQSGPSPFILSSGTP